MLSIVRRGGATREKPPEVVRGQASRLPWAWDGLCFALPFNDSTRDAARDLVVNAAPAVVNGLTWARDNRGNPAAYLAVGSWMDYPDNPAHNRPTTSITAYVRMRRVGIVDSAGGILGKRYATGEPYLTWALYHHDFINNAVQGHLFTAGSGTSYLNLRSNYVVPTTIWVSVFMRWQSGTAPQIDILGERGETLDSTTHGSTITGTLTYVAGEPITVNRPNNYIHSNSEYSQMMVWARRLTDVEMQAVVADPYGWYSPRRETVGLSSPYPLVFGGGEMRHGTGSGGLR